MKGSRSFCTCLTRCMDCAGACSTCSMRCAPSGRGLQNSSAMHMLYARHHVRVYRFALRVLRDRALSEDVVSDVFLEVWRSADQFEGRSAVSTWLLGIARLKAFSALKRCPEEELDERAANTIEDPADDPASSFERKET